MNHYVCPGCGVVSEALQTCETQGCNMMGQEMKGCNCDDGMHGEIMSAATV